MGEMMIHHELAHLCLVVFALISGIVCLVAIRSSLRHGLRCRAAFYLMWAFAYGVPTFVYLLAPDVIASMESYRWMRAEEWVAAALVALLGAFAFQVGYSAGIRVPFLTRIKHVSNKNGRRKTNLALLVVGLVLQLYPLYLLLSRNIAINFAHRSVHWTAVGLSIRFAFFALPTVAIATWYFLENKTPARALLFFGALAISFASAISLAARAFLVLMPIIILLVYTEQKPRTRTTLFALLFAVVIIVPAGYYSLFRAQERASLGAAVTKVMLGDIGRMHTLAYTVEHATLLDSDLVDPPILGSYFYSLILPIPRRIWTGKPYATNIQFSYHFRQEHTSFYVPFDIAELTGKTEFGFIEEALLNLGFAGMLIMVFVGLVAAQLDKWIPRTRYLKVVFPIFFILATIYTFNGILNYLAPFFIFAFLLDGLRRPTLETTRCGERAI